MTNVYNEQYILHDNAIPYTVGIEAVEEYLEEVCPYFESMPSWVNDNYLAYDVAVGAYDYAALRRAFLEDLHNAIIGGAFVEYVEAI